MKTYSSILTCKRCGKEFETGWHKNYISFILKKREIKFKHLKEQHNMKYLQIIFRNGWKIWK